MWQETLLPERHAIAHVVNERCELMVRALLFFRSIATLIFVHLLSFKLIMLGLFLSIQSFISKWVFLFVVILLLRHTTDVIRGGVFPRAHIHLYIRCRSVGVTVLRECGRNHDYSNRLFFSFYFIS